MPSIARGQECTTSILNWFIAVNGVKTDAFEVGCQIWDISGGMPGTVVWPVPGDDSQWEDESAAPGKFGVGSYYPYDNTLGAGWKPGLAEPLGDHRIKWRWKISAAAPYQEGMEDFTVLIQSGGSTSDEYVTVQEIRDEGVPDPPEGPTNDEILAMIQLYSEIINRFTRCFFNSRQMTLLLDGSGHETLHLPFPLLTVSGLEVNLDIDGVGSVLVASDYVAYNRDLVDDKRNPRIQLRSEVGSIFTARAGIFTAGFQNQKLSGTFGWLESGATPAAIKRAAKILVIKNLGKLATGEEGPDDWGGGIAVRRNGVLEEKADRHSIKFADIYSKSGGALGQDLMLINDPTALALIRPYVINLPAIAWSSRPFERAMMSDQHNFG